MKEYLKAVINPLGLFIIPGLLCVSAGVLGLISGSGSWGRESESISKSAEPIFFWFTIVFQLGFGAVLAGIPVYLSIQSVKKEKGYNKSLNLT